MLQAPKLVISLQPAFMMFTDGLVKIKTKKIGIYWPDPKAPLYSNHISCLE
jgi:hypothetical protein